MGMDFLQSLCFLFHFMAAFCRHLVPHWTISWFVMFGGAIRIKILFTGDFEEDRDESHVVCVDNVIDFTSAFLFSVETQHTIG